MEELHRIGLVSFISGLWIVGIEIIRIEIILSNTQTGEASARTFVIVAGILFIIVGFLLFLSE